MSSAPEEQTPHRAIAFGRLWQSELPLPYLQPAETTPNFPAINVIVRSGPLPQRGDPASTARVRHAVDGFRYFSHETAVFDAFAKGRIDVYPGPAWKGELAGSFFGTVTACLLGWQGAVPMHGSAVCIDGRALLICGHSGAGKSSLTAALVAQGAKLISDDLSVLHPQADGQPPLLYAGRRTIRLYPEVARLLQDSATCTQLYKALDTKHVIVPPRAEATAPIPLAAVLLLGEARSNPTRDETAAALVAQLYRAKSLYRIPGHLLRLRLLGLLTGSVPVLNSPAVATRDQAAFQSAALSALALVNQSLPKFSSKTLRLNQTGTSTL